jgi:hypothetical protein
VERPQLHNRSIVGLEDDPGQDDVGSVKVSCPANPLSGAFADDNAYDGGATGYGDYNA